MPRALAALNLPRRIPDLIMYARSILTAMTGNPAFPSPTLSLSTFENHITALDEAHVRTLTRTHGTVAERDALLVAVHNDLVALRTYVQDVADTSPGEQAIIIATAGMSLKRSSGHTKPTLKVTQGLASGAVRLAGKAARTRASYDWQRSQDGRLWIDLPRTVRADAELSGLLAGAEHFFRYRTLTRDGVGEWSQTVSFFVR